MTPRQKIIAAPTIAHLEALSDKKVKAVVVDDTDDDFMVFGLEFYDGTIAWILADPEGNGPGHLEIKAP